jgi:hypothetical protein
MVLATTVTSVAARCFVVRKGGSVASRPVMPGNSGNSGRGCWRPGERTENRTSRAAPRPAPGARTAIGGVLYTFLSAYGRLAPSGLRRFILQSRSGPVPVPFWPPAAARFGPLSRTRWIITAARCVCGTPRLPMSRASGFAVCFPCHGSAAQGDRRAGRSNSKPPSKGTGERA